MAEVYSLNATLADDWLRLDDDAPAPTRGRVLVSIERLRCDGETLKRDGIMLGASVQPDVEVESFATELPSLALIELRFPSFADGRAFSQARELRERFGFAGDIRASGEVLRDQLSFMVRCGFNQFDLAGESGFSIPEVVEQIRHAYQRR